MPSLTLQYNTCRAVGEGGKAVSQSVLGRGGTLRARRNTGTQGKGRGCTNGPSQLDSTPSVLACLVGGHFRLWTFPLRPCKACLPACPTRTPASRPKLGLLPLCPKPFRGPTLGLARYPGTPYPAPVPVPGTVPVPVLSKEQGTRTSRSKQAETWLSLSVPPPRSSHTHKHTQRERARDEVRPATTLHLAHSM